MLAHNDTKETFTPDLEISPQGYEFFYIYDKAGRKTLTERAKADIIIPTIFDYGTEIMDWEAWDLCIIIKEI